MGCFCRNFQISVRAAILLWYTNNRFDTDWIDTFFKIKVGYILLNDCLILFWYCLCRLNESSDDTLTHSYNQETFEETATSSQPTKKMKKPVKSPLDDLKHKMMSLSSPRSPRSLFSQKSHTRTSESESEDSYSVGKIFVLTLTVVLSLFHGTSRDSLNAEWIFLRAVTRFLIWYL